MATDGNIASFRNKETEEFFRTGKTRVFAAFARVAIRRLEELDEVPSLRDLGRSPGNHLEALRADREGQHSIRINQQYRICFVWREGRAYDVEIVDYH